MSFYSKRTIPTTITTLLIVVLLFMISICRNLIVLPLRSNSISIETAVFNNHGIETNVKTDEEDNKSSTISYNGQHDLKTNEKEKTRISLDPIAKRSSSMLDPKNRMNLFIHVGPSKTATTTLQTDLTRYRQSLEKDGYYYGGRYYHPTLKKRQDHHHSSTILLNRSESHIGIAARTMLFNCSMVPRYMCCQNFTKLLQKIVPSDVQRTTTNTRITNIILSDEAFSGIWTKVEDYIAIRDAIIRGMNDTADDDIGGDGIGKENEDHWKDHVCITIVVTYRRLFDWIVSSKFQRDRVDRRSYKKELWPAHRGRRPVPLLPNTLRWWKKGLGPFHYINQIIDTINDTMPIKIMNLHELNYVDGSDIRQESIVSNFLCHILPNASSSCQESCRQFDQLTFLNQTTTQMNVGSEHLWTSIYYDAIAVKAADLGLINISVWSRPQMGSVIQNFYEANNTDNNRDNVTSFTFPLKCPSEMELNELLQMSLRMEEKYVPTFYNLPNTKRSHIKAFQKKVKQNEFCWIDTEIILQQIDMKRFLSQFGGDP